MKHLKTKIAGFTLIELMIVVAIVAILAAIAYPSYQSQVRKSRRSDAFEHIQNLSIAQERYNTQCNTYTAAFGGNPTICTGLGLGTASKLLYYNVAITGAGVGTYTLTATPAAGSPQVNDTDCASISLNSAGFRASWDSGGNTSNCWPN